MRVPTQVQTDFSLRKPGSREGQLPLQKGKVNEARPQGSQEQD